MSDTKNTKKLIELKNLVEGAEISLQQARQVLDSLVTGEESASLVSVARAVGTIASTDEGQVIEGIFDGQNMVGPDGKKYSVPANYASKSKMLEGDKLKLTITPDGSFVYKQIQPLERIRLTGKLILDEETGDYRVLAGGKSYKVLSASITYFKGEPGQSVIILVPKDKQTTWAAVENVFESNQTPVAPEPSAPAEAEHGLADKKPIETPADAEDNNQAGEFLEPEANQTDETPSLIEESRLGMTDTPKPAATDHQHQPQDILSMADKVNTNDITSADQPESTARAQTSEPLYEQSATDDLDKKDSQGLEEI